MFYISCIRAAMPFISYKTLKCSKSFLQHLITLNCHRKHPTSPELPFKDIPNRSLQSYIICLLFRVVFVLRVVHDKY